MTTENIAWLKSRRLPPTEPPGNLLHLAHIQQCRYTYIEQFGWGIVSAEALDAIADLDTPITEVFSGVGYWAYCLRQRGVDIIASDQEIWPNRNWTEVLPVPADKIAAHTSANRAMMMVWPPCSTPAPTQVLELFRGNTFIHVGEYRGCTADEAFFDTLELQEWTVVQHVEIPKWPGLGDSLTIYRRKSS